MINCVRVVVAVEMVFALLSCGGAKLLEVKDGEASASSAVRTDFFRIDELQRRTEYLAHDDRQGRDEGTDGGADARAFLINELIACGVAPAGVDGGFTQPITTGIGTNILGVITGTDPARADRMIIVSAHYDHLGVINGKIYNGAEDNASSVASVIAVACATAHEPLARSVLIALWDAEEPPTFLENAMGSQYFVAHPTVPLSNIDAALVLDLNGCSMWGTEQGHNALGSELSPQVKVALNAAEVPVGLNLRKGGLHLVEQTALGEQVWSDYDAFRDVKVPVLFFSDGQNTRYHTTADDSSALDFGKLTRESVHLNNVTRVLGSASENPVFVATGSDPLQDALTAKSLLTEALASTGGLVSAMGLGYFSKLRLQQDLSAVSKVLTKLQNGGTASSSDLSTLRTGVQRVMCHSSGQNSQLVCNLF